MIGDLSLPQAKPFLFSDKHMIRLDFSDLDQIPAEHGLSEAERRSLAPRLPDYLAKIAARNQGFYSEAVLADDALIERIGQFVQAARGKFDQIVVLGIGGSSLGPIALRDAFKNPFVPTKPELLVLDNIDPDLIAEATKALDLRRTLFLTISKSGGTPETVSQYFYFLDQVQSAGLAAKDHFVFVTDPQKSFLLEEAHRLEITCFPIPSNVGGRFSVLTAVGLLPAALIGIDISKLLAGALTMQKKFLSEDAQENLPFTLAAIQYLLLQKGKTQNVIYPYAQKLFRVGDWCRQLIAESTGKRHAENGDEVFAGITPIASLGATDQHSQNQLYFEGPNDKLFLFLEVENFASTVDIPLPDQDDERFAYLKNTDFQTLLNLEKAGTAGALTKVGRPHVTIKLPRIDEEHLGAIFLLFEGATAFLGEFLGINAFDQPGVELSKNITRELLLKR